ncbi:Ig-like domain-containing protein [Exiguobacterium sp. s151]|uniref:Ig-like domain-containing protein n=1 Tax=Exiguobacterium sp. s151 TaxID=2751229 RepID=UPI001BE8F098|nr:Ig-like domain-containing protein [Exiguobacterium sp. s151]
MKRFYTYVLIIFIILASLSFNPEVTKADNLGPTVSNVSVVKSKISRGEELKFSGEIKDEDGVSQSAIMIVTNPENQKETIEIYLTSYDSFFVFNPQSIWAAPAFGEYVIHELRFFDRYGNTTSQKFTDEQLTFEIIEDTKAPIVKKVEFSKLYVYNNPFDYVEIEVFVEDEGKPSQYGGIMFKHKKTGQIKASGLTYDEDSKTYKVRSGVWHDVTLGDWEIEYIELMDVAYNHNFQYGPFEGENVITVRDIANDIDNPEYVSSSFKEVSDLGNSFYQYNVNVRDDSYIYGVDLTLKHRSTNTEVTIKHHKAEFTMIEASGELTSLNIPVDIKSDLKNLSGFWDVVTITILDENQNKKVVTDIKDSIYIERYLAGLDALVVHGNTTWSNQSINQDVFIMPGAIVSTFSNVIISKNIYNLGSLRSYGGLTVLGTLYGNKMTYGHTSPIYNGDIQLVGSNSIRNIQISNQPHFNLPIDTGGALVENGDGTFDIMGLTLPISEQISVNGVITTLDKSGRFKIFNVPMNDESTAIIRLTSANGLTYTNYLNVYNQQKPVISASEKSGIYLAGTKVDFVSTKEGVVFYDVSYGTNYMGHYTKYNSDFVLNNDVKVKYYSVDPTGIESEIEERKYRVFSVYNPKASETFIQGSGSPGLKIQAEVDGEFYTTTINSEGRFLIEGLDLTESKRVQVLATDEEYTSESYTFNVVDDLPIIIKGAEDQKVYNRNVTITYNKGELYLNGIDFVASGTSFDEDGYYELNGHDGYGHYANISFTIDKTAPQVSGIQTGKAYKQAIYPTFAEGTATLNGVKYTSGTKIDQEGEYVLIVIDQAENKTTLYFTIDYKAPIVSGIENGKIYNQHVTPIFNEGIAKLNGNTFVSGTTIKTEGSHELVIQDLAGNTTVTSFIIDLTAPVVSGVQSNTQYTQPIVISFNEGSATLNGKTIAKNYTVNKDGAYELKVKDSAGNETVVTFELDQLAPVVTGVEAKAYRQHVTPVFVEGTGTLNGNPYVSGTPITTDGEYELAVSDRAGNKTVIQFKVDQKSVTVTGVESGKMYQLVTPLFSEGTAVLNGVPFTSGTVINQSGVYVLLVTDEAGNETKLIFNVDATAPTVTGFIEGINNYREVSPTFTEGTGKLNGKLFVSGTKVMQEGKHVLRVTDQIGNETVIPFTIDRTAPIVTGVKSKQLTNQSVVIKYNEGTATLNGKRILNNWSMKTTGNYTLRVTDQAGNLTVLTFTIDKVVPSKPTISTLTNKSTKVTGKAEKGSTVSITYNGRTYTTKASTAGTYSYSLKTTKAGATVTVRAKDAAGNLSTAASSKVLNTFATFTVNTVKSSATSVTGKGNRTATVQAFVGTKAISKTAKVDSKGNYKLTIPRQKAGMTVTVKMTQTGYQELKKTTKVVK